ncbi:hypothetical protein D9M69_706360 [compost metagenome]
MGLQLGFVAQIPLDESAHVGTSIPYCPVTGPIFRRNVTQQPGLENLVMLQLDAPIVDNLEQLVQVHALRHLR